MFTFFFIFFTVRWKNMCRLPHFMCTLMFPSKEKVLQRNASEAAVIVKIIMLPISIRYQSLCNNSRHQLFGIFFPGLMPLQPKINYSKMITLKPI